MGSEGQDVDEFLFPGWASLPYRGRVTVYVLSQRLLLMLQDKDKEVEELLQEIQCEKVPSPARGPLRELVGHDGWSAES